VNITERLEITDKANGRRTEIMRAKGAEYAGTDREWADCNQNFKHVGQMLGLDPKLVCGVYMLKHVDSLATYLRTGIDSVEGITGRLDDIRNYIDILESLIIEEKINAAVKVVKERDHSEISKHRDTGAGVGG
jgi:hypothetical protein